MFKINQFKTKRDDNSKENISNQNEFFIRKKFQKYDEINVDKCEF